MTADTAGKSKSNFRRFFLRGLGIILPTVATIWILMAIYNFVDQNIADPINAGVRELILLTPWPEVADEKIDTFLSADQRDARALGHQNAIYWANIASRAKLQQWWNQISVGNWQVMNLIGLAIAIVLIYMVGGLVGSFIGRRLYARGEEMLHRVPVFRAVYPYVKQVTDFLVGSGEPKAHFSDVVAVEYPRKGLWSVGLVTGDTMSTIQDQADQSCITVFVPSSPTPFTGYVITVPKGDTIDLPISIDQALRFTVSGGVIIPPSQVIAGGPTKPPEALAAAGVGESPGPDPQNKADKDA